MSPRWRMQWSCVGHNDCHRVVRKSVYLLPTQQQKESGNLTPSSGDDCFADPHICCCCWYGSFTLLSALVIEFCCRCQNESSQPGGYNYWSETETKLDGAGGKALPPSHSTKLVAVSVWLLSIAVIGLVEPWRSCREMNFCVDFPEGIGMVFNLSFSDKALYQ